MKKSVKTIVFAFVFSAAFAFSAVASDKEAKKVTGFATGIYVSKEGKINLNVDKYTSSKTTILITNRAGNVIYREVLGKELSKFKRSLNVDALPSGKYTLEVSSNKEKQTNHFEISEEIKLKEITLN